MFPSEVYTLMDLPQSMAEGFLADNESHLKDPIPADKHWELDRVIALEAQGINCQNERQMAKRFFNEPQFTPKRGMEPTDAAKPEVWDVPF